MMSEVELQAPISTPRYHSSHTALDWYSKRPLCYCYRGSRSQYPPTCVMYLKLLGNSTLPFIGGGGWGVDGWSYVGDNNQSEISFLLSASIVNLIFLKVHHLHILKTWTTLN